MLRLPLLWFQTRRLADILGRLTGVDTIRSTLTSGLTSVLDGVLSVATLVMIAIVSPPLAGLAVLGFALYVAIRLVAIPVALALNSRSTLANVAENSARMESLRTIQSIKAQGGEANRETEWSAKLAESFRVAQDNAMITLNFNALQATLNSLVGVAVVYVGARSIISGSMTVGVLTAAIAYQSQFGQRAANLFEQFISWRLLDVQLERVADIVLEDREPGLDRYPAGAPPVKGALSAKNLGFQYSPQDPFIFEGLDFEIAEGEHVAIVGPSGRGKSTLLKVMTGLYAPSQGQVLLDGAPLGRWGPRAVRQSIGLVLQDDKLLAGSIAENVSFFDPAPDVDHLWDCLRLAGVDEEISAMPAGPDTLIGDLGEALSGGQKQRVLIARALYRRPRILILDEATSHLDVPRERSITETLQGLQMTRIVVAHRPQTIAAADRVLMLHRDGLHPPPQPAAQHGSALPA
jgi:ATP-binding cassette subfamily B protein RaxB